MSLPSGDSTDSQYPNESPGINNSSESNPNLLVKTVSTLKEERFHHPDQPLHRSKLQKIAIWLAQCGFICMGYYFCSHLFGGPEQSLSYLWYPPFLQNLPLQFWGAILFVVFFTKIFSPTATLCGALIAEWILESGSLYPMQPILLWFLVFLVGMESRLRYHGGEFAKGKRIFHQVGLSVLTILLFLPMLYFFTPFPSFTHETFSLEDARIYYSVVFLSANFLWILPLVFFLWLLDRTLLPYFPLTPEEKEELLKSQSQEEITSDSMYLFIPQPGEYYQDLLTHHPLLSDDHTIVFNLGKVRIYFCTRCTGTLYGTFFGLFFLEALSLMLNFTLSPITAIWLIILLPLFPIADWGFQALHYRPANTTSRLITGFILGLSIIIIQWTQGYEVYMIIILIVYFSFFFLLSVKRRKIEDREFDEQNAAFQSKTL